GALTCNVPRLGTMTIAAFERIVGLHTRPFMLRKFEAMVKELLARIDYGENLSPDLLRCLHFARYLLAPFIGYVAIWTTRAHARSIVIVHGCLQLFENVGAHLVTRGAEGFGISELQSGIESTPEKDSSYKTREHQKSKAEYRAWPNQNTPNFKRKRNRTPPKRGPRDFGRRHRGAPGPTPFKTVSMSTKSLSTGIRTLCWGTWHWVQKYRRGEIEAKNCPSRSEKCVTLIMGACDSRTRVRA